jgi:hypothetical protein
METLQSARKYGQYHRSIARPILFWLNGSSFMSRGWFVSTERQFRIEVPSS